MPSYIGDGTMFTLFLYVLFCLLLISYGPMVVVLIVCGIIEMFRAIFRWFTGPHKGG